MRPNQLRLRSRIDFRTEVRNVGLDRAWTDVAFRSPDQIKQLIARQHALRIACEHHQQVELPCRKFDRTLSAANDPGPEIDAQIFVTNDLWMRKLRSAQS